jgi:hypothetical protein
MAFETLDLSNGITVVTDGTALSKITFANTGIFNLQFSTQFQNTDNAQHDIYIWLRKNGTTSAADVLGSTGFISIPARRSAGAGNEGHVIVSWNFLLDIVAGDFYQIIWATNTVANVTIQYYAGNPPPPVSATNYPSTASTLFTVTQQSGIMAGTGITAINSLTGSAQTLATNGSGTDFNVSSVGTTHTFNLPTASATNRGALSSADWTTFNGKQAALGFTPVTNARTISTTSPLSGGGDLTANRTLSIPAATTSADGYLTSTDWSTFNNKLTGFGQYRKAARWYNNGNLPPANGSFANVNGQIRYVPVIIDQDITITRLGVNVTVAGPVGSLIRLGIYSNDPTTTQPLTRLVDAGTVAADGATGARPSGVISVALTKGLYWFAYFSNATSGNITGISSGATFDVKGQLAIAPTGFAAFNQPLTFGTLPATATTGGVGTEVNSGTTVCIYYLF